jgi:hypothetical protein
MENNDCEQAMSIELTSGEKKFVVVAINVTITLFVIGIIGFDINAYESGRIHFYYCMVTVAWTACIPFIGKSGSGRPNIMKAIFMVLIIKMCVVALFDVIDSTYWPDVRYLFPGWYDLKFQYQYVYGFFTGYAYEHVPGIGIEMPIPGGIPIYAYYPPGVPLVYILLTSMNPMMNTLMYRWYILFFEAGVYYLIWKIANIPSLRISPAFREKGVFYAFFGISMLTVLDFFAKYDAIVLLICLVGAYFYLNDHIFAAGCVLVFAGFVKIYPFVWMAGIIIHHLRRKQFRTLLNFITGGVIVGAAILAISIWFEGLLLFKLLFGFQFNIAENANALYMMNVWFFLGYTGLPMINLLPYVLLLISLMKYFMRKKDEIDISFFIKTTSLVFIFYTAVNSLYINLIFPFICIGMLGSIKKVRVLAFLEIAAIWVEQLFNTIYYSSGGLQGGLMLYLDTLPDAWCVLFRFINLGLFLPIFIMLVLPERFERWFPIEADSRLLVGEKVIEQ